MGGIEDDGWLTEEHRKQEQEQEQTTNKQITIKLLERGMKLGQMMLMRWGFE